MTTRTAAHFAEVDGKPTCLITLHNSRGMSVSFTNLGGKILQIVVPDRNGRMDDVALGYDNIQGVIDGQSSMGAFVGRFANRIAKGRFTLDGVEYAVEPNNNGNSLHGGPKGSRYRVFDAVQRDAATADLTMYYESKVDGFPGNLMSRVVYQVTEQNELVIRYDAVTDSPTVVNMTSHVFFNLAGHSNVNAQSLARHELMINAETFTPVGKDQVPTGEIRAVAGTPMDFRRQRAIGEHVADAARYFEPHVGYDHNWVIDKPLGRLGLAARLHEPVSGRIMEVLSTEPGLVFYGGNNLEGIAPRDVGKGGHLYERRSALCLEPAHHPDSPNHPHFPSTVLRPGEWFSGTTIYRFSAVGRVGWGVLVRVAVRKDGECTQHFLDGRVACDDTGVCRFFPHGFADRHFLGCNKLMGGFAVQRETHGDPERGRLQAEVLFQFQDFGSQGERVAARLGQTKRFRLNTRLLRIVSTSRGWIICAGASAHSLSLK